MTIHEEYRASWPNDEWVWDAMTDRREFFARNDDHCSSLKNLSVPKAYWPTVHVRTITVQKVESAWVTWGEHQRKSLQHSTVPEGTSNPKNQEGPRDWGTITPRQIERVRAKRFSLSDPCVICGGQFEDCSHTMVETELFVQYVRNNFGHILRQKP